MIIAYSSGTAIDTGTENARPDSKMKPVKSVRCMATDTATENKWLSREFKLSSSYWHLHGNNLYIISPSLLWSFIFVYVHFALDLVIFLHAITLYVIIFLPAF